MRRRRRHLRAIPRRPASGSSRRRARRSRSGRHPAVMAPTGTPRWCLGQTACRGGYRTRRPTTAPRSTRAGRCGTAPTMRPRSTSATAAASGCSVTRTRDRPNGVEVLPGWGFLRNTVAVQRGGCFEFRLGGTRRAHRRLLRAGRHSTSGTGRWTAVVDPGNRAVYVSAMHATSPNGPPDFTWRRHRSLDHRARPPLARDPRAPSRCRARAGKQWGTSMLEVRQLDLHLRALRTSPLQYVGAHEARAPLRRQMGVLRRQRLERRTRRRSAR